MIKMAKMMRSYVERIGGTYRIAGTRVNLDSVVHAFRDGLSPESMRESFPALNLEEVQGAITFYLARTPETLQAWAAQLRARFGPAPIAVGLEQSRGALLSMLPVGHGMGPRWRSRL